MLSFSGAILVNSQTLTLLKFYGVAAKIAARGRTFNSITIYDPSKTLIQGDITSNSDEAIQPMARHSLIQKDALLNDFMKGALRFKDPMNSRNL